ncbi:putative MFS-type transporter EfpA [Paraburkholderia domus]|jgi:Arabinose efflux permease|uniref:MFS-type transporter EfpA n=1 Tax=Paraburkholderia domus TaxID=2793075 RepID=A0A9N8QWF5_9BURK|nr:MFS transporter [Paraburkholderia domus]MBK5061114.1 MFS transporter [Burkholderia sp. R-70199]MBK5088156.1 MFS transporter [Burkholderia sp. R-69927]MBK5121158.1 MFS transporter [Burkholderia sp. R-69980]MBK5166309.1 MFS transporter [Burkholderia sp. R-70211]MBK5179524.1 MFS transporter [Burkholderia sp. R-69749]
MTGYRESRHLASGRNRLPASTLALVVILACQLMVVIDGTVMYAALPRLRVDLQLARADLSWVQNVYMLTFGGFMLLGARAGDILGHRRVFLAASAAFVLASSAGGLAQSVHELLLARGLQGIAAAFAAPSALALLMLLFPEGEARVRAISLYTAVSGGGSAAGLVLGGVLTDFASWRWVLFINVPIGALLLMLGPRCLPEAPRKGGHFDVMGALTVTLGTSLLVYGLVRYVPDGAARPGVAVPLIAAGLLITAFVLIEKRARQPIIPLSLFASTQRSGAYAGRMLLIGGMLATFFFLTQYVQEVLELSAFHAGLAFLPLSVTQFLMVMVGVPWLLPRLGGRRLLAGGLLIAATGMVCLSRVGADTTFFADLALPIMMLGIGTGAALVPLTTAGIAGVAPSDAGAASGLINATHYIGGAMGTAVVVFVVDLALRRAALAHGPTGSSSELKAKAELTHALSVSATTSAAFFVLALLIVLVTMRSQRPLTAA